MGEAIPKDSVVYVLYRDNIQCGILPDATERETIGWLAQEIGPYINIQHDRTIESIQYPSGSGSGILVPKNSIKEIHVMKRESE
jgi:hypothetical protein